MAHNWLEIPVPELGPHNWRPIAVCEMRELQAAPAKATMAEALSIDMDEMMAILAETEPEHSHATDDMTIELNVVFNIMTDVERSDVSCRGGRWLTPVRCSACEFE